MKILVAGDYCPQNRVAELFEKNSFLTVLCDVKAVIDKVNYSIVNFECPVTTGNEIPIEKLGPNLHCSEKAIEALQVAGFDCVTLANNHIMDYGEHGLENTIKACSKKGIDVVGGGKNLQEASEILYKRISGNTLAIINCCEHEFSIASDSVAGANPLNPIQQYYSIQEAKTKADYVMVIVHGGHEHYQYPSARMQETYRFFIDAGADCVVNHHQHCFSGFESYKGKLIFYGLGNFCFDNINIKGLWNEGYMVIIDFDKNMSFEIIPYIQCDSEPKISLLEKSAFDKRILEINNIISNSKKLGQENMKYYSTCSNNYGDIIEPSNNKYYLAFKYRGLLPSFIGEKRKLRAFNYIACEAHRDILLYFLKKN